jgi:hypothetical protein
VAVGTSPLEDAAGRRGTVVLKQWTVVKIGSQLHYHPRSSLIGGLR